MNDKLVEKIARAMRTKQMHILGYTEFKDDPEDGATEGLDLELAQVALQAVLSDPNICEIDRDAELPRYLTDSSTSIPENVRRYRNLVKEAGWVKLKEVKPK